MSSCCGGNCGCGSGCKCGSGCGGCGMYPDLGFTESTANSHVFLAGIASANNFFERSEMKFGVENDCKCGSNCSCGSCNCK